MSRRRLLAAVRERMRAQTVAREAERPSPRPPSRPQEQPPDPELERLEAESRYHRDRYDLYHARVVSGSSAATSLTRLRELKRTATAAADRLAHARRRRSE
jgi:hypothetical protein